MTGRHGTLAERFWPKVDASGDCWLWTGARSKAGYGQTSDKPRAGLLYAHRVAYELLVGPIPDGMQIDHLCRVRHCVNPDHLEAVTPRTYTLRGYAPAAASARRTACPKGHPYDAANTQTFRGYRRCRTCNRDYLRALRVRRLRSTPTAPAPYAGVQESLL